ncbi:class I SAM-dependent methyltransferase, partial [Paenibacillus xylanexedens]|uniref:class I SAM-dependent methyltransferase n=1 Tax=Paenibacillus xylanexedens TaxID=528191 RepID=UPI0034D97A6B
MLKWIVDVEVGGRGVGRGGYCEEVVVDEVRVGGREYVIVGGGLERFGFRDREVSKRVGMFELDRGGREECKESGLGQGNWNVGGNVS